MKRRAATKTVRLRFRQCNQKGTIVAAPCRFCPFRPLLAVFGGLSGVGFCVDAP